MPDLKSLSRETLTRALEKAERYRLLKEPEQAASICQDVLLVEPENQKALEWFGKAEALRPAGNDDALLRWNTCVRVLESNSELQPAPEERTEISLE